MKIMFINSVVDFGSTGKIVRDLANGLKEQGHDVLVVYGRENSKTSENTFSIHDSLGLLNHGIMTRLFGRHGLHSKNATNILVERIKEFNPDIVHLHNLHGYYLNVPMLFETLDQLDIKVYWTLHDAWSFSGSSAYFDFHGCKLWDEGCVECVSTRDYPKVLLFPNQKKNFKWKKESFTSLKNLTIVTPSDWLTEMSKRTFLNKYPILTINNGVDLNIFKFQQSENRLYEDKFVILGVANVWEKRKGLQYFKDLSPLLKEKEIIVLVGLSKDEMKKLPQNIIGIERTKDLDEMVELYSRADVFLNPTLEDNFPTTNLEALACGTPIITFDTGGSPEVINVSTGFVCESRDIKSIRKSLDLLQDSSIQYSKTCRMMAEENYSKEMMLRSYYKLFSL